MVNADFRSVNDVFTLLFGTFYDLVLLNLTMNVLGQADLAKVV